MSSSVRPSRGRIAPAPPRPANASSAAGSRPKPAISSATASTTSATPTLTQNNAPRSRVTKTTTAQAPTRTRVEPASNRVRATTTAKGTLPKAASSTSSRPPSAAPKEHTRSQGKEVALASEHPEALQVAAQSSAWRYMTSTLEVEFMKSKNAARATLDTRRNELVAEEADMAESRVRFEAERLVDFYDELGDRQVAEEVATIILRFKNFERTIGETTAAALRLTSLPLDETTHVSQYNNMLDHIDSLEDECRKLEAQVLRLSSYVPRGATVAEPFLLSSYPESSTYKKRQVTPLFASAPSGSNADPFVTVAVQGDGVHVLDASTLHPAVSHILGPSTSFSCSPATRTSRTTAGTRKCASYAILESGPDVQPEGKGKTVVAWEEELSGGVSLSAQDEKKKRTAVAPHPVRHAYAPEYLPELLVLVSASGDLSLLDEKLGVLRTFTPQNHQPSTLLKHFLFPSFSCSFLPPHIASTYGAVSVSFLRSGDVLRLNVVGMDGETITSLGECVLPVEDTDLLDISCSSAGFISVLLPSGTWLALSSSTSPSGSLSIIQAAEPLRLQGLTFIGTTRTSEVTLAALTSSHVLLSAVTSGSPMEIVTLLWDLRYGVLLTQQSIPVPSTLPRPKKHGAILRLQVSPASSLGSTKASTVSLNAILVLLPSPEREHQTEPGSAPARSSILVVPVTVPLTSTIAAAMGKANAGTRWVSTKPGGPIAQGQGQMARGGPELSAAARKALREIKAAIDGSANSSTVAAETVFFEYVKQQGKGKGAAQGEEQNMPVEYPFVQGVLEFVLRAPSHAQGKTAAYSQKIIQHLLESRVVSSSMVEGGVLPALAERNDWGTISLAMRSVTDLPEHDIISLLSHVVKAHALSTDDNAMQVDSAPVSTGVPALPTFLAQCVVYPFTPALQRTAIRKHLSDAAGLVPILEVIDRWIVQHTADDALLSASDNIKEGEAANVPSLDKVLAFLQSLLDASFLALLAHSPAHKLLRALTAHIQPALAQTNELELLCGPLEPFARAAAARAKTQAEAKEGGKPDSGKDWRRKRKLAHEQAGMAVGLYQVEELVL